MLKSSVVAKCCCNAQPSSIRLEYLDQFSIDPWSDRHDLHTLLPPNPQILATFPTSIIPHIPLAINAPFSSNPSRFISTAVHRCSLHPNHLFSFPSPKLGVSSFKVSTTVQYCTEPGWRGRESSSCPYRISASSRDFGKEERNRCSSGN
jgi:hypothetical protein